MYYPHVKHTRHCTNEKRKSGRQNVSQPVECSTHKHACISPCVSNSQIFNAVTNGSLHRVREHSDQPLCSLLGEWDNQTSLMMKYHGDKPRSNPNPGYYTQDNKNQDHQRLKPESQASIKKSPSISKLSFIHSNKKLRLEAAIPTKIYLKRIIPKLYR